MIGVPIFSSSVWWWFLAAYLHCQVKYDQIQSSVFLLLGNTKLNYCFHKRKSFLEPPIDNLSVAQISNPPSHGTMLVCVEKCYFLRF